MRKALLVLLLWSSAVFAVIQVGEKVPNLCWKDDNNRKVCLNETHNTVRILLYSAGWCGPCNQEFSELVPRVGEFQGQPVVFMSLSCESFDHSEPDAEFLKAWRERHQIPFTVAASPFDCGKKFIPPKIYIPNVAIIGKDGNLSYKAMNTSVDTIFSEVRQALAAPDAFAP